MSNTEKNKKNKTRNLIILGVILFLVVYISPSMVVVVGPGEVGVLFRPFSGGTITELVYGEGLHVIAPWNKMYKYNARLQTFQEEVHALSKNGLSINTRVSMRYHLKQELAPDLHKNIGQDYVQVLLVPTLFSSVREVIGEMAPEELYTSCRVTVQDRILEECRHEMTEFPLILDKVILENMKLPATVNKAIENKLRLEQAFLEYEYKLKKEAKEIERQLMIAQGIKKFQAEAPDELSPGVKQWLGYHATLELAKSPNTKVMVLSGGEMHVPLVIDPLSASKAPKSKPGPVVPTELSDKKPEPPITPEETSKLLQFWQKAWNEIKGDQ